ncbi:MAG: diaminopimelate decarboxylase, partial [Elusimicrobiota bacterium]|nr:diaminopimelate decarboxylase [Elusimicrobiota bacterium]
MLNNLDINLNYNKNSILELDNINLQKIAKKFGTPTFVYSYETIKNNFFKYQTILKDKSIKNIICFAIKTNSNTKILQELNDLMSGFDTVSMGEIFKAINAGANPQKIIYSGVGKT